jgi:hypothetical protein
MSAFTGFGGSWSGGVHSGGDSSGSTGGGSSSVSYTNYGGVSGPLSQSEIDNAINEISGSHRPVSGTHGPAENALNAHVQSMSGAQHTAALAQIDAARRDAIARGVLSDGSNTDNGGGSTGSGTTGETPAPSMSLHNGQMGYWEDHTTGAGNNEHTTRVFVAVGPSEAEKAAAAAKNLQEKQQAEAAAAAAAQKAAADAAAAAEKARQDAVNAGALAGQHMSVADAQTALNSATADVTRLNQAAQNAAANASQKRQAANNANAPAAAAESARDVLLTRVRGMSTHNGDYGYWNTITTGVNNSHTTTSFSSVGPKVAEVDAAKANATNLRAQANQLAADATAAEQASAAAAIAARDAETRRQAAAAALSSAQQAAEIERQHQASEAAAAAAAEQKRLADIAAAAAEAARVAAEQEKAHQARQAAADKLKSSDIQSVRGISATAAPAAFPLAWSVASGGGISLGSDLSSAIWSGVSAGLAELRGIMAASMVGSAVVTVAGLLYSRDVGAGSDLVPGRDISTLMPGDVFGLPDAAALNSAADTHVPVTMPVRGRMVLRDDGTLETQLVRTPVAGSVPVVRGVLDPETGYWGYTLPAMQGVPGQTILVSPSDAPGVNGPLGLTGPVPLPEKIVHTGGQDSAPQSVKTTVTPVADDLDFNDLILIFPPEALLKPLYVMLRSPRNMPGTADGKGQPVGDNWLGGAGTGDGAPVPSQIADKLRGKTFGSFDSFRRAFWKAVAADPDLSKQFEQQDIERMKLGRAPVVDFFDVAGKRMKVELHHKVEISKGGDVYNVDNLNALTPKRHVEIHKDN